MNQENIEEILKRIGAAEAPPDVHEIARETSDAFARAVQLLVSEQSRRVQMVDWLIDSFRKAAVGALAAAAVIVLVMIFSKTSGSVAWAEVVAAVEQVDQVHMSVFVEDADDSRQITLELYYKRPNIWRGHGLGMVQFVKGGQTRLFDTSKQAFVEPDRSTSRPIPPDAIRLTLESGSLLEAILRTVFTENVPPAEPVVTVPGLASEDVEVFDYSHKNSEHWVRIWVMRKSRLPIRLKLFSPQWNETILAVIDYTDPQPDDFFNPERFEEEVKSKRPKKMHEFYRIGQGLLGGKPKDAGQIYQARGGYQAPEFVSIEASDNEDLLIVSIDPENKSPNGGHVPGEYHQELRDNWGNVYLRYFSYCPGRKPTQTQDPLHQYYTPVQPFIRGHRKHNLTLRYIYWDSEHKSGIGYDRVIHQQVVKVPEPTVSGIPDSWYQADQARKPFRKSQALSQFGGKTLMDRLTPLEEALRQNPDSPGHLLGKVNLLKELGDEDDAYLLFEEKLLPTALEGPFRNFSMDDLLARYLLRLYNAGRESEFWPIVKRLEQAKQELLSMTDSEVEHHQERVRKLRGALPQVAAIGEALKEIEKAPKPEIAGIAASEDAVVMLEIKHLVDENGRPDYSKWAGGPHLAKGDYELTNRRYKHPPDGTQLLQLKGAGAEIELQFSAFLREFIPGGVGTRYHFTIPWPVKVQVPKPTAATIEELKQQFPQWKEQFEKESKPDAWDAALSQAGAFRDSNRPEKAIRAYEEILDMNEPHWHKTIGNKEERDIRRKAWVRLEIAQCLAHFGRFEEAKRTIDNAEAELKTGGFWEKPSRVHMLADQSAVFANRVIVARKMIEQGHLDLAHDYIAEIESTKPDFRIYDNIYSLKQTLTGGWTSYKDRDRAIRRWDNLDRARWLLMKARRAR
ncbi:MAG: tetratricopeptide repeat protein [Planctomycetota bacterium]|jgi:tetratricopeptide (TPR) repeat protein